MDCLKIAGIVFGTLATLAGMFLLRRQIVDLVQRFWRWLPGGLTGLVRRVRALGRMAKRILVVGGTIVALLVLWSLAPAWLKVVLGGLAVALAFWIAKSIKTVQGNETGLILFLGKPIWVVGGGPCFVPLFLGRLIRYPTPVIILDYGSRDMLTGFGDWGGQYWRRVKAAIDLTAHFWWPRKGDLNPFTGRPALMDAFQACPPPTVSADTLSAVFFDAITAVTREKVARTTQGELVHDRSNLQRAIKQTCLDQEGNPIREGGLSRTLIVLEEVRLPENYEKMLPEPDIAELEVEAAQRRAEVDAAYLRAEIAAYQDAMPRGLKWTAAILAAATGRRR
jgi:hypothetical protein